MNDATATSHVVAALAATYLLHSTLLLATCWLLLRLSRATSHFLAERLWKLAAVTGLVTAPLHLLFGGSLTFELADDPVAPRGGIVVAEPATRVPVGGESLAVPFEDIDHGEPAAEYGPLASPSIPFAAFDSPGDEHQQGVSFPVPAGAPKLGFDVESAPPLAARPPGSTTGQRDIPGQGAHSASRFEAAAVAGYVLRRGRWGRLLPLISKLASILVTSWMALGGALLLIKSWRLRTRFATSRRLADGPARQAVERFLKRQNIRRRIRLLTSPNHHEPIAYGLFTWTIVLPDQAEQRLGKAELQALLAHEIAHLARGDVWWLWVGRLLCHCLAFQPLNFLARSNWQRATEYLCDDWAVQRGVQSLSLARCLTQIAQWRFGRQTCRAGLAAGGPKATLVQRVERLVEAPTRIDAWERPLRRRLLAAAACLIAAALVGLTPSLALPRAAAAGSAATSIGVASLQPAASARLQGEWQRLQEELRRLDAELIDAAKLLEASPRQAAATGHVSELNQHAATLRARGARITSLLGKESIR